MLHKHISYLKYVLRHKWYVFLACRRRGAPLWASLVHDLSKFRPDEWRPYATWFYDPFVQDCKKAVRIASTFPVQQDVQETHDRCKEAFERAFLLHLHRNPHHWQYWVLPAHGDKPPRAFEIPLRYVTEMVADWDGAGRAITGVWDTPGWYSRERAKQVLHPRTLALVDELVAQTEEAYGGTVPD